MTVPIVLELTMVMLLDGTGTASLAFAAPDAEGLAEFDVANWRRPVPGILKGTFTYRPRDESPDPHWERFLAGIMGVVRG